MSGGKWRSFLQFLFACSLSWFMVFMVTSGSNQGPHGRLRDATAVNDSLNLRFMDDEDCDASQCEHVSPYAAVLRDYGAFDRDDPVRILSWNKQVSKSDGVPWYPEGKAAFRDCGFDPPLRCEYTQDKRLYNISDAVLFRAFFIKDLPTKRIPGQKWVFWEFESPRILNILQNLQPYKFLFNITSTYSMTSDVPLPYLRKCVPEAGELNVDAKPNEDFSAGKDRLVAWFSSHCQTPSRREHYAKDLQKHIPLDIYGKCGPFKCSTSNRTVCLKDVLEKRYKFVLAFENSLCREYVTDTIWDVFQHHVKVVPIVLGGADYTRFLPKGTYIDVRDYKSPSHLAVYLKYLDRHPEKYNEYIWRRNFDQCQVMTPYSKYECGLCKHLHEKRGLQEIALNVATDWGMRKRCLTPKYFYQGVATEVVLADAEDAKKPAIWGL